jgi:hypothetical protein
MPRVGSRGVRRQQYTTGKGGWKRNSNLVFTKESPSDLDLIWLKINLPNAIIKRVKVKNPTRHPRYNSGEWDGWMTKVTLSNSGESDLLRMNLFRHMV